MPINMTRDEYEASHALMALHFPDPPNKSDLDTAFRAIAFNISGGGEIVALRFVDGDGLHCDLVLDQAVSAELVGHLAKSLHAMDWIDSAGNAMLDPARR